MPRILPLLAAACAMSLAAPGTARALPAGTPFEVFLSGYRSESDMGTLRFSPSMAVVGGACRYAMEWSASHVQDSAVMCWVDEATWHGFGSCAANATGIVRSIVQRAPGQPCSGFDTVRVLDIFEIVWSERAGAPALVGILQFSPATGSVYGVEAYLDS